MTSPLITQDAGVETFSSILRVLTLVLVAIASISLTVPGSHHEP